MICKCGGQVKPFSEKNILYMCVRCTSFFIPDVDFENDSMVTVLLTPSEKILKDRTTSIKDDLRHATAEIDIQLKRLSKAMREQDQHEIEESKSLLYYYSGQKRRLEMLLNDREELTT